MNQVRSYPRQAKYKSSTDVSNMNKAKLDGGNTNRGCAMRHNHYSWKNVELFYDMIQSINERLVATPTE